MPSEGILGMVGLDSPRLDQERFLPALPSASLLSGLHLPGVRAQSALPRALVDRFSG